MWGLAVAAALLAAISVAVPGCGPSVSVSEDSPRVAAASIASAGDGTEAGQRVDVTLTFDAPVSAGADAAGDFAVTLNGEPVDDRVASVQVASGGADSVVVSVVPSQEVAAGASARMFALYSGEIEVASARADGALPHVVGKEPASGSGATAVLEDAVEGVVPSGVVIAVDEAVKGDASAGVPASCAFTVVRGPVLRCCTWLDVAGESVGYIHNHQFRSDTPESCARAFADMVNASSCGFSAQSDGATVRLVAASAVDGQDAFPSIREGVGADAGHVNYQLSASGS